MNPFTCCISPGHTPTAQGASRGIITEYGLSAAIVGDLIFKLSKAGHTVHLIGSDGNAAQVEDINRIGPDFGLELHFNANIDADVNGSMCLHYPMSKRGIALATKIQVSLTWLLGTKNAGVHSAHYQLDLAKPVITMIADTNCPFVVVEPLYLSNDADFERIDIQLISTAIMHGCVGYWEANT